MFIRNLFKADGVLSWTRRHRMNMLRVVLTRAELLAMHLAMGLLWVEHQLDHDPDAKPLRSALIKFHTALRTWDGESNARLVMVAGKNDMHPQPIKLDVRTLPVEVKREPLTGEAHVQWNCFCKSTLESCPFCRGCGYLDQWLPANMLTFLNQRTYRILGRRHVQATPAC
jgi:hypothetical protein